MASMATNDIRSLSSLRRSTTICTDTELSALDISKKRFKEWTDYRTAEALAKAWFKKTGTDFTVSVCGEITDNPKKYAEVTAVCCILFFGRKSYCYTLKGISFKGMNRRESKEKAAGETFKKLWKLIKDSP